MVNRQHKRPTWFLTRCFFGLRFAVPSQWLLAFLPHKSGRQVVALERRLRGYDEALRLRHADWVLVSWGKSGRTWLRTMLSYYYRAKFNIRTGSVIDFSSYHILNGQAPKVLFTHDNYLRDYTGNRNNLLDFKDKKIVFLARDPRDVAVSQYFQWRYRMRSRKKTINQYPPEGTSLFNFMLDERQGLPGIIAFMNQWATGPAKLSDFLLIKYEDMRLDPARVLAKLAEFTGLPGTALEIEAAVNYAKFENMKKREGQPRTLPFLTTRMSPGDAGNPDSYKTRKGKVGGYTDYFNDEQIAIINKLMLALSLVYGYSSGS